MYNNSAWKDLLTSYNGKAISYDAIGNPTAYDGWTFTWSRGRTLSSMNKTGKSLSFKYNENGIRTQKTYNGITTNFFLDGSKVVGQKTGSEIIYFQYDANGAPTVMNYNGTNYYYVYNGQGDVVALYNSSGAIVCEYEYDSWGNPAPLTGSLAATVGTKNPFRYRGYYYDTETGLYYLNSRYYNPEWCRFINADGIIGANGDIISSNLFVYCSNNQVNHYDPTGQFMMTVAFSIETAIEPMASPLYPNVTIGPLPALPTLPTTITFPVTVVPAPYAFAKGGRQRVKETWLEGKSPEEIAEMFKEAKANKDNAKVKKIEAHQKGEKLRNIRKRANNNHSRGMFPIAVPYQTNNSIQYCGYCGFEHPASTNQYNSCKRPK